MVWRDHFHVHSTKKTTMFPATLQRCRGKRSYVIFCACGTCLILHSIPLRASVPSLHISGKLFVLPLQTLRCIPLINRQKPRHSQQAFRLHFISPQPLPLEIGIASFPPATCLPRISGKSPPPFSGAGHNIFKLPFACGTWHFLRFITFQGFVPFVPLCTTTLTLHFTAKVP